VGNSGEVVGGHRGGWWWLRRKRVDGLLQVWVKTEATVYSHPPASVTSKIESSVKT